MSDCTLCAEVSNAPFGVFGDEWDFLAGRKAGDIDHTLYTLLIDRRGRGRVLYDATVLPSEIVHDLRLLFLNDPATLRRLASAPIVMVYELANPPTADQANKEKNRPDRQPQEYPRHSTSRHTQIPMQSH